MVEDVLARISLCGVRMAIPKRSIRGAPINNVDIAGSVGRGGKNFLTDAHKTSEIGSTSMQT